MRICYMIEAFNAHAYLLKRYHKERTLHRIETVNNCSHCFNMRIFESHNTRIRSKGCLKGIDWRGVGKGEVSKKSEKSRWVTSTRLANFSDK